MYEVLAGLRIHPVQYLLVGLSIALFYLLLLSFAELIGFLPAYLIAAIATTLLITSYCFSVLRARKRALSIAVLLIALYGYLFILLQLDQYSLLFGSVLLFGVLATVMYLTRKLDWYSLN
jgi:inner membrane protein